MVGSIDYTDSGREQQTRLLILKHVQGHWTAKLKIGCSGYAEGILIMAQWNSAPSYKTKISIQRAALKKVDVALLKSKNNAIIRIF